MNSEIILWQRLDKPGHEIATIRPRSDGWQLSGVAIVVEQDKPCRLDYDISCDARWMTRRCVVRGSIGSASVHREIERNADGEWSTEGSAIAAVRGCHDIDLGFSPVTNLLPIKRLDLAIGGHATVTAAWVRFPELTVEALEQTYVRVASNLYRYESAGGAFRRELTVDAFGCVVEYPGIWHAEARVSQPIVESWPSSHQR